jgi:hypothetical protein
MPAGAVQDLFTHTHTLQLSTRPTLWNDKGAQAALAHKEYNMTHSLLLLLLLLKTLSSPLTPPPSPPPPPHPPCDTVDGAQQQLIPFQQLLPRQQTPRHSVDECHMPQCLLLQLQQLVLLLCQYNLALQLTSDQFAQVDEHL